MLVYALRRWAPAASTAQAAELRRLLLRSGVLPIAFVASIPLGWLAPGLAILAWLSIIPLQLVVPRVLVRCGGYRRLAAGRRPG